MSKVLDFILQTYTAAELTIKVKNVSAAALKEGVTIELHPLVLRIRHSPLAFELDEHGTSPYAPTGSVQKESICDI